jgi:hypothetical protein
LLLLSLFGCGPEQIEIPSEASPEARKFAEAFCGGRETCKCSDARFDSQTQCESASAEAYDAVLAKGLVPDAECLESVLVNNAAVLECRSAWKPEDFGCPILWGTKDVGEACDHYYEFLPYLVSDCKDGLMCYAGTCVVEPFFIEPKSAGDPCHKRGGCGTVTLRCGRDGRCHEMRPVGEPCDDYVLCDLGLYCKGLAEKKPGICSPKELAGSPCNPGDWVSCETGSYCSVDSYTCTSKPTSAVCQFTHPIQLIDG